MFPCFIEWTNTSYIQLLIFRLLIKLNLRVLILIPIFNQDFLNDRLQEGFLRRIRYAMKPDEAYGLVFSWDNVVVNYVSLQIQLLRLLVIVTSMLLYVLIICI